jgi:hypothetical protein
LKCAENLHYSQVNKICYNATQECKETQTNEKVDSNEDSSLLKGKTKEETDNSEVTPDRSATTIPNTQTSYHPVARTQNIKETASSTSVTSTSNVTETTSGTSVTSDPNTMETTTSNSVTSNRILQRQCLVHL